MKNEWSASDYKKAACKHMRACTELINLVESPNCNQPGHKEIFDEIFYLSGYVVECILKYGILKCLRQDKISLSKEKLQQLRLKTHNLKELKQLYIDNSGAYARELKYTEKLEAWSEEMRYYPLPPNSKDYFKTIEIHFKETIKSIFDIINQNY